MGKVDWPMGVGRGASNKQLLMQNILASLAVLHCLVLNPKAFFDLYFSLSHPPPRAVVSRRFLNCLPRLQCVKGEMRSESSQADILD